MDRATVRKPETLSERKRQSLERKPQVDTLVCPSGLVLKPAPQPGNCKASDVGRVKNRRCHWRTVIKRPVTVVSASTTTGGPTTSGAITGVNSAGFHRNMGKSNAAPDVIDGLSCVTTEFNLSP